ncbi:hypothetical protein HYC85_015741 [Camellia sinensis]|uniref:Uncharacterized protein n=1 Tax=Camellia sinensis TaxID=4442 RepID=A0A7J7GXL3_CAMSI|nr:hypothetical protein HYC85_015741 [Camellia sinensis]
MERDVHRVCVLKQLVCRLLRNLNSSSIRWPEAAQGDRRRWRRRFWRRRVHKPLWVVVGLWWWKEVGSLGS